MSFVTKKIDSKIIGIIDIGTYKIRVGICEFKNRELDLIGYGEKRQNKNDIVGQEFHNIEGISENIKQAIQKAEEDGELQIDDIIINIPFEEIFFTFNKINYIREDKDKIIDKEELDKIMGEIENISLKKHFKEIKENYGYQKEDLRLIISSISEILIDSTKSKKLLGKTGENINISLINIFIPETKYETIKYIANATGKNIIKIIPSEFALTKLFKNNDNIVIIDLGSCSTSIIVKKEGFVIGVKKISAGINDLIKQISKNHNKTPMDVISSIDDSLYLKEKKEFLSIFEDILTISLEEILGDNSCPPTFFMTGGGANQFIKRYLKNIDLNKNGLKILRKISFIEASDIDIDIPINEILSKSNLNIYSMMIASLEFIKKENDPIEESLNEVIKELK